EDDHPAHRRRTGLLMVALRSVLADLLPELTLAQELDELGAEKDADQQRGGAPEENLAHSAPLRPGARRQCARLAERAGRGRPIGGAQARAHPLEADAARGL